MIRHARTLAAGLLIALHFPSGCAAPKPTAPAGEQKIEIADVPADVPSCSRPP